jgi:hypothetical protein
MRAFESSRPFQRLLLFGTASLLLWTLPVSAAAASRYAGRYVLDRAGADSSQHLTLTLEPAGKAKLLWEYGITVTAAGTRVYPMLESGKWTERNGRAVVRLTQTGEVRHGSYVNVHPYDETLELALRGCTLKAVEPSQSDLGSRGLVFTRKPCP